MEPVSDLVAPDIIFPALLPQNLQRSRYSLRSNLYRPTYRRAGCYRARCARDEHYGSLSAGLEAGGYGAGRVVEGRGPRGGAGGGFSGEVHATGDRARAVGAQLGFGGADAGGVAGGGDVVGGVSGGFWGVFETERVGDEPLNFIWVGF